MRILILTLLILKISCLPAFAYIDPGTFSLILTYIVSGIAGAYLIFKNQISIILKKIKQFSKKNKLNKN